MDSFKQKFNFPNDVFKFGKHTGKEMRWVIDNDLIYYNWLISKGLSISYLVKDYAKGVDIQLNTIRSYVDSKKDELTIRHFKYWKLDKEKFVRGKDKSVTFENNIIGVYKIDVPFEITKETKTVYHDYTKFHCDCSEEEVEFIIKIYDKELLYNFIKEKLALHILETKQ